MDRSDRYEVFIYVSGMHLLSQYGSTYREVLKDQYENVHVAFGQQHTDDMSYNLGVVLTNLAPYTAQVRPDMIVVHGDRIDALAGAITGALNNILVAHIEGGEISGTIDDSIRHAVSKFAHLHFVCNEEAKKDYTARRKREAYFCDRFARYRYNVGGSSSLGGQSKDIL